jgi:hypothetical protein
MAKINFWDNSCFYGVDLSQAVEQARNEFFSQPVVGAEIFTITVYDTEDVIIIYIF